eukprot:364241-Chlamydomonas_euryale.AAC.8
MHAQIREFLEKHYVETSGRDTVKLTVKVCLPFDMCCPSVTLERVSVHACVHGHLPARWVSLSSCSAQPYAAMNTCFQALLETVEAGSKCLEVAVMEPNTGLRILSDDDVDAIIKEIEEEKAALEAAKRGGGTSGTS